MWLVVRLGLRITIAGMLALSLSAWVTAIKEDAPPSDLKKERAILKVAGLADGTSRDNEVLALFVTRVERRVVKVGTSEDVTNSINWQRHRQEQVHLTDQEDLAKIQRAPVYAEIYIVRTGNEKLTVLPVYGMGLWSKLYGMIAIKADGNTVAGIYFYDHRETPDLGDHIQVNEPWLASWKGLQVYDQNDRSNPNPRLGVSNGAARPPHLAGNITGATQTFKGVDLLLKFWLGPRGFGPYLRQTSVQ